MNKTAIFMLLAAVALSSCDSVRNLTHNVGNSVSNAVGSVTKRNGAKAADTTAAPETTATAKPAKAKTKKKTAENPAKPAKNVAVHETVTADQLAGEWNIVAVGQTSISDLQEMPYITFADGRFYGSNGCNVLNGNYRLDKGVIEFGAVAATMRYCPDVPFEHEINVVLAEGQSYRLSIEHKEHETYLHMLSSTGHRLLTARRHNMGFLNGQWLVTKIGEKDVDNEECNIFFDIPEGKVHGNTGCNFFNGDIYISTDRSNAIELSNMGVTRMACPDLTQETAMLVALEQTASAVQKSEHRVVLLDKKGNEVITLRKDKGNHIND